MLVCEDNSYNALKSNVRNFNFIIKVIERVCGNLSQRLTLLDMIRSWLKGGTTLSIVYNMLDI